MDNKLLMKDILSKLIKIIKPILILIFILFMFVSINIIMQWGQFAEKYYIYGDEIVYGLFSLLFIWAFILPILKIIFMKGKQYPKENWSFKKYKKYCKSLSKNTNIDDVELKYKLRLVKDSDDAIKTIEDVEKILDEKVQEKIKTYGKSVFISTAVSQNAKLDGLSVIIINMRLIWEITKIYNVKPTLKDLWRIYADVLVTGFLSIGISEIPTEDLVEPLLQKISGGFIQNVPLGVVATNAVADSLFEGSANCLLTLRIGIMTKYYNKSISRPKDLIRKKSFSEALEMITPILRDCTYDLSVAISKKMGTSLYSGVKKATKSVYDNISDTVNSLKTNIDDKISKVGKKDNKKRLDKE